MRDTAETGLSLLNTISQTKFNETLAPITVDPDEYAEALQGYLLQMQDRPERMEKQLSEQQMTDEVIVEISDEEEELCSAPARFAKIGLQSSEGEGCVAVGGKELLCGVREGDGGATSGSQDRVLTSAGVREGDGGATSSSQDDVVTSASVGDATDCKVPVVKSAVGGAGTSSTVGSASGGNISVDPRVGEKYGDASVDSEPFQYIGKSHNKCRQCPFCEFHGVHLARHLASMHPDCTKTQADRARIVYKADEDYRQKMGLETP